MWLLGVMTYLIPRLLNHDWYSRRLAEWHFWLSGLGVGLMAGDLILAGPFQGWSWASLKMWDHSIEISMPFWAVRVVAGLMMFAGQLVFLYNIYRTHQLATAAGQPTDAATA